jgi:aminopeptidase N
MTRLCLPILLFLLHSALLAQPYSDQPYSFSLADTLRGALRPERSCYDVHSYDLNIRVDIPNKTIKGFVDIAFRTVHDFDTLQIDLYENMTLSHIEFQGKHLGFRRIHNAVFVGFPRQKTGNTGSFRVHYEGSPRIAQNAPWDGGFVWTKDRLGNPWIGVACEGDGASLWWPCKDHLSDEPDSMFIRVAVPTQLTCVANGKLIRTLQDGDYTRYDWKVSYPINNYNATINIGKYIRFSDTYTARDGEKIPLNFYVLPYNEKKARTHFKQVHQVLAAYEHFFDKYPFSKDGYALIETPYLGMEHQSAIAYGNKYMRGYLGGMIPKDMDWDYIIVHETGHEYFGNCISCNDLAEMWIHESFTTYMEALFVEYHYNYTRATEYLVSQLPYIKNREPIIGPFDVNWDDRQTSDHYYKGAWMLHTLRSVINNDTLWFSLLKSFYRKHACSNINSQAFFDHINTGTGKNFEAFFEQYLHHPLLPTFVCTLEPEGHGSRITFHWKADVPGFNMPIAVGKPGAYEWITPGSEPQTLRLKHVKPEEFRVDTHRFLIDTDISYPTD